MICDSQRMAEGKMDERAYAALEQIAAANPKREIGLMGFKEILRDPIDREMVRSINEIGHLTGKQTIAEFAESEEVIAMLKSLGVDYAQGYGVSMPQSVLGAIPERVRGGI